MYNLFSNLLHPLDHLLPIGCNAHIMNKEMPKDEIFLKFSLTLETEESFEISKNEPSHKSEYEWKEEMMGYNGLVEELKQLVMTYGDRLKYISIDSSLMRMY